MSRNCESYVIATGLFSGGRMGRNDFVSPEREKMSIQRTLLASVVAITAAGAAVAEISEQEVIDAQTAWGDGIVAIAKTHADGGDFAARATDHINTLYAYGDSDVMFKPTLAAEDQFRESFEEALSYFIGTDGSEDSGFAIKGWTKVRFESNGIFTTDDAATAMGNYYFTGPDGTETKVEYSFGYVKGDDGQLKINLHHSSLPYAPS